MELPKQIGPYLIHSLLGRGGMGVVYEAEHRDTGEMAAVKTIRRGRRTSMAALRREIAALAELRHPGIVRVLDTGAHEGRPWYAMEFVSGTTLGDAIQARQRGRGVRVPETRDLPAVEGPDGTDDIDVFGLDTQLRDLLGLMGQVCHALAHLHGMGRVHLDLKPANIMLESHGRAVLVDFGVAVSVGGRIVGDALATTGLWAGTARYTAPERLWRAPFDARADLFAVGCLLYEVLTGRPAWFVDGLEDARAAQRDQPQPRPSVHVCVPPVLDDLVYQLLAPDPAQRVGHALEVVRVLEELGIDCGGARQITSPRPYLYDSGVAGRRGELAVVQGAMREAIERREGQGIILSGVGGVGKTRLAAEAAREVRSAKGLVLTGECRQPTSIWGRRMPARPFHVFERLVRYIADTFAAQPGSRRPLAGIGQLVATCFPFLAGDNHQPPGEPPSEEELVGAFVGIVKALVTERPTLFVFDDLQWADPCSLRVIRRLAEESSGRPWVVLGLARTEQSREVVEELVEDCWREVRLRRLEDDALDQLIQSALGTDAVPAGLSEEVLHRSKGIPLVAGEFLQYALVRGDLRRSADGRWLYELPSAAEGTEELEPVVADDSDARLGPDGVLPPVTRLLSERLNALGAAERLTLEATATFASPEVDVDLLHEVTGLPEGKFGPAVASLVRYGLLRADDPWNARSYGFVHDKVRAGVRAQIPEGAAARLNRACAEALADRDVDPAVLATHWEAAGALEAAARACARAAARACSLHRWDRADRFAERALRHLGGADPQALALRVSMAGATAARGRVLAALGELEEVIGLAREADAPEVLGRALLSRSRIHARRGDFEAATRGWVEAIRLFRQHDDRLGEADALTSLGAERAAHAQCAAAAAPLSQAEQIYDELNHPYGLARVHQLRGTVANEVGSPTEAKAHLVRALRIARAHGFAEEEAGALAALADVDTGMGRDNLARTRYETALGILRDMGARGRTGTLLWKLASAHANQGRFDMALEVLALAEEANEAQDPSLDARLGMTHARVLMDRGNLDDATARLDDALLTFERLELRAEVIQARILLGSVHALAGRFEASVSVFKHAGRAIATHDLRRLHLPHLVSFARALSIAGALDGAERRARKAIEMARVSRQRREEAWAHYVVAKVLRISGRDADTTLAAARRLASAVTDPVLVALCRTERVYEMPDERAEDALVELSETAIALGCTERSALGLAIRNGARVRDLQYAHLEARTGHHRPTLRAKALEAASRSVPI